MTNESDPNLQIEVQRLHKLTVYARWLTVILLWISVGSLSIWSLRHEIDLWFENFTWAAVRYGLYFHRWPTLGLVLCLGMTLVVLRQSRNVRGFREREKQRLEQQVRRIRQQGPSHPLWKWVCKDLQ
ncbi:MAG: hypothetical protein JGK17_19520 [Microcoleus sp. PH2017_10_PVI_O_A]|uniref:hypothetical protein n=1 Tax=unclassified Microcoleus TaxID=2642155 RepID=UPI001DCD2B73|nr:MULTISPECIES: hypothetical protein [unclassified Microcoleus]TAE80124.1 MAG: hypothetical protein EAZ83_19410 [Oscillatoriales cyanobacterium]MCC3407739.1 hypothetical protein [Microcoleus sp. PH2017_10_PVI_O_A]MCC3459715.1 hypothetical protein [Microcoleus sp. PH2017_11_PCY_U_A]MCC3480378.1 hypothetical protein [Microcoleus sp. PH2017_12_PCY_D_A]MCC3530155.1 hypothetical protein [Microcoleus sp. PH2017_21_RUC_O_A]